MDDSITARPRMKPEIKKRWVEALRSGKYNQTKRFLKAKRYSADVTGFCCLGVLCDLAEGDGIGTWVSAPNLMFERFSSSGIWELGEDGQLPVSVQAWAGLTKFGQYVTVPTPSHEPSETLVHLNDSGATFKQIANIIEEEL